MGFNVNFESSAIRDARANVGLCCDDVVLVVVRPVDYGVCLRC